LLEYNASSAERAEVRMPTPPDLPDREAFRARFVAKLKEEEARILAVLRQKLSDGGGRPREES